MHCKYLSVVPYKALEKFSNSLYGTTESTYSARVFRPVMAVRYQERGLVKTTLKGRRSGVLERFNKLVQHRSSNR